MIAQLINKTDTAELARDAVAQILANESANQVQLAIDASIDPAPWAFTVYRERFAPIELKHNDAPAVVVNLERTSEKDAAIAAYNDYNCDIKILVFACAKGTQTQPADEAAALRRSETVRIVRNILAAGEYSYLNMQKQVGSSRVTSITFYSLPVSDKESAAPTLAAELTLTVTCREQAPQITGVPLDSVAATLKTGDSGEIVAQLDYTYGG